MEFTLESIVSGLISILLVSLAIHFGAKPFARAENEKFLNAILVAVLGSILATLVEFLLADAIGATWARVLALATWALVAAAIYRTSWIRGALIGVLAWLLWFVVSLIVAALFN